MNVLVNAIAFKLGWLSAIIGGANELPVLVMTGVSTAVAIHLWRSAAPAREVALLLMTGLIGLAWDSVMVSAGWLVYPSGTIVAGLAPYWIIAMWVLFATTLNVTFRWLREKLVVAAVMGAVFGPVSYIAGASAGAVEMTQPLIAIISIAVAWSVLMPGLVLTARELDGTAQMQAQGSRP